MFKKVNSIVLIIIILSLSYSCINDREKINYVGTHEICNGIYIEIHTPYSGGVFDGDTRSVYITDSTNFQIFLGSYEDYETFSYNCKDEKIICIKKSREFMIMESIDTTIYSIEELKSMNNYPK
mgnify:CR=1 FL=1